MSFALGFVKGLVGGFTENIKKEQEARGMDDQRLAAIEDTMIQASLDPKKRVPEKLATMVKDAKAGLKQRGGIDIFGRAGPRLELDIKQISNIMNEVDDDDKPQFIKYGFGENAYKIEPTSQAYFSDSLQKDTLALTEIWLKSFDRHLESQENIDRFLKFMGNPKNALSRARFIKDWIRNTGDYKELTGQSYTSDGLTATKFPNLAERFTSPGLLKDLVSVAPSEESQEINAVKKSLATTDPDFNFDKDTILVQGADNSWRPYKFIDDENGLTAIEKMTALKRLAKRFVKSGDVNEFIALFRKETEKDAMDFEGAGGVTIDPVTKKVITDLTMFRTISPDKFRPNYQNLFHAINLEHLGASKSLKNSDLTEAFGYLQANFVKEASDGVLEFDGRNAIRALASVIKVPESDLARISSQTPGVSVDQSDEFINDIFQRTTNTTLKEFMARWEATKKTMNALNTLKDLKGDTDLPASGFVPTIAKLYGNVVIPTGVADQFGSFFSSRGALKKGTTQQSLEEIIVSSGLAKNVANLTKQEALMIALAADMARAVDPSGRLSNQDFEVQLRRLGQGGFFTSKISEMSALQTVIDDFQTRYNQLEMIALVVTDSTGAMKNLTKRDLQILHANKKFYAMKQVNQGEEELKPKLTLESMFVDDDKETKRRFLIATFPKSLGPPFPPNHPLAKTYPNGRPTIAYDRKEGGTYKIEYDENDNMVLGQLLEET